MKVNLQRVQKTPRVARALKGNVSDSYAEQRTSRYKVPLLPGSVRRNHPALILIARLPAGGSAPVRWRTHSFY